MNFPRVWIERLYPLSLAYTYYPFLFFFFFFVSRRAGRSEGIINSKYYVDGQESQNTLSFVHARTLSPGGW